MDTDSFHILNIRIPNLFWISSTYLHIMTHAFDAFLHIRNSHKYLQIDDLIRGTFEFKERETEAASVQLHETTSKTEL